LDRLESQNGSVAFWETDKLKGLSNNYVWSLKMRAMLRVEGQWGVTSVEQNHTTFPITIDGETLTEAQLKKKNALACRLMLVSVSNDLIDLIADCKDPVQSWKVLKD